MTDPTTLLPYRLSIAGLHELDGYLDADVSHVISFLDPDFPRPATLDRLEVEWRETFRVHDIIDDDDERAGWTLPSERDVARILAIGERLASARVRHLLVHCHMGMSRSTAAAAMLMAQHNPGREADVFAALARIRRPSWPNSLMLEYADRLLGRDGACRTALDGLYRDMATSFPRLADQLRHSARAREIPEGV